MGWGVGVWVERLVGQHKAAGRIVERRDALRHAPAVFASLAWGGEEGQGASGAQRTHAAVGSVRDAPSSCAACPYYMIHQ